MTLFRHSRCEVPHNPPLTWVWLHEGSGQPSPVLVDLKRAGVGGALPDGIMRRAELITLVEDACHGDLLQEDDEFRAIAQDPNLWELKIHFGGRPYRLYIGEPPSAPGFIVALHFHRKDTEGSADNVRDAQDAEIELARARYQAGEADGWTILTGIHQCGRG